MFRTVPLSIIRSFSLYTQQWYMSHSFADSLLAGPGDVEFYSKNKFEKLVHLVASYQQTCMTHTTAVCTVKNS